MLVWYGEKGEKSAKDLLFACSARISIHSFHSLPNESVDHSVVAVRRMSGRFYNQGSFFHSNSKATDVHWPQGKDDRWSAELQLIPHHNDQVEKRIEEKTRSIHIGFVDTFRNCRRDYLLDNGFLRERCQVSKVISDRNDSLLYRLVTWAQHDHLEHRRHSENRCKRSSVWSGRCHHWL